MKKRILLCVFGALAALSLASCGEKTVTPTEPSQGGEVTPTPTEPAFDAASLVGTFDESINTTVKLNYEANYGVDVVREGADASGMASFKHEIRTKSTIEMDLGTDLYIKITKEWQDLLVSEDVTKIEELLYKKDGKYYYQNNSTEAVEVTDAKAKLASILADTTYEQVGGLSLDALLYNSLDKSYELKVFGLSDTFIEADLVDPVYSAGTNGGLHVEYKPEYVGYRTDGGWSDFSNSTDGHAAVIKIDTNNKGYVTSWSEQYNTASLVFAIMTPPPTVTITGERHFTATYGETITKSTGLEVVANTAVYEQATGGTFVVKTCAMGDFGNMVEVANGGTLEMGKLICVKPTAAEGKEVDTVTVNGSTTPLTNPAQAGGYYCFNVVAGENTIVVTFKDAEAKDPTKGTVTVPTLATAKVEVFTCAPFAFTAMTKVENGGEVTVGNWLCVKVTPAGSNTVASVTHNGSATTLTPPAQAGGFYCFTAAAENEIAVAITGEDIFKATINITNASNIEYELQSFVYGQNGPENYQVITDNTIVPGNSIFGAIVVATDTQVTVEVNGVATTINIPSNGVTFYCFAVKTADTYEVVIKGTETADPTVGTVTIPTLYTADVQVFTCAPYAFTAMTKVENGGEVTVGNWLCVKVTPAGSNTVASVTHNGSATTLTPPAQAGGFYCFTAAAENEIAVTITGEEVFEANINITNASNVEYELQSFVYGQNGPENYQVITDNKIDLGKSVFGAIVVASGTSVTVTVDGVATTINIPSNGVTFYCFAIKAAGTYNVVITPNTAQ